MPDQGLPAHKAMGLTRALAEAAIQRLERTLHLAKEQAAYDLEQYPGETLVHLGPRFIERWASDTETLMIAYSGAVTALDRCEQQDDDDA